MGVGRSRYLRPARDYVGERVHRLVDGRVRAELAKRSAAEGVRVHGPGERLHVADSARIAGALLDVERGTIEIGPRVVFGHDVAVVTSDPSVADGTRANVRIEAEAQVGSRVTIVGPCTIGARATIAPGTTVTGDIPPAALVRSAATLMLRDPSPIPPALDVATDAGRFFVAVPPEGSAPALHDTADPGREHGAAIRAAAAPGSIVVDVGARVGWHTIAAAGAVGAAGGVIAFEADPAHRRLLAANLVRHGCAAVVVRPFDVDAGAETLDDALAGVGDVALLNVVTRGTEHLVLRGAAALRRRCRPPALVRFSPAAIRAAGHSPAAVLDEYRATGAVTVLEDPAPGDAPTMSVVERAGAVEGGVTLRLDPA